LPNAAEGPTEYLKDGQPDWEAIDFDVCCGRCGYNLRMLPEARCPECGLEFDWPAVLDAAAWRSDFLFEHHWRQRPFRSWAKTVWRSFRPKRFWLSIPIHTRVHPGPLAAVIALAAILGMLVCHGMAWGAKVVAAAISQQFPELELGGMPAYGYLGLEDDFAYLAAFPFTFPEAYVRVIAVFAVAPVAAFASMTSIRQTLGRRRVRVGQVFRVFAYAATPQCIFLGLWMVLDCFIWCLRWQRQDTPLIVALHIALMLPLPAIQASYLHAGLKYYLKLPRPWALAIAAIIVGWLSSAAVVALAENL
jgi:hypothetical protein